MNRPYRRKPRLKASTTAGISTDWSWLQLERAALGAIAELAQNEPAAMKVMFTLMRHLEPHTGGVVVASRQTLCELTGYSMPTMRRAIAHLTNHQWVQRIKVGSAYAFAVNTEIAWIGPREKLQHAAFAATVIAARSEQKPEDLEPRDMRTIPIRALTSVSQFPEHEVEHAKPASQE